MPYLPTRSLPGMARGARSLPAFVFISGVCLFGIASGHQAQSAYQQTAPRKPAVAQKPKVQSNAEIYQQSWELLQAGSKSESLRKRTDVIAALSSMEGDSKAIRLLETALDDKHAAVRRIAASSLGTMNARDAIPYLQKAINDKDAGVSFAAAEALWKMGDQSGAKIFYAVVLGSRHVEKGFVSSQINTAWNELHNPVALANIGIGEASGALLGPFSEGITIARELAEDRSAPAQALSATLLGERPNLEAEKILVSALQNRNLAVRAAVAKALGGFNDPALISRLAPLLSKKGTPVLHPEDAVRFMVAAAIIRIYNHEKPDSPIITATLRDAPPLHHPALHGKPANSLACPKCGAAV